MSECVCDTVIQLTVADIGRECLLLTHLLMTVLYCFVCYVRLSGTHSNVHSYALLSSTCVSY